MDGHWEDEWCSGSGIESTLELLGKRICMDSYVYKTKEVSICS